MLPTAIQIRATPLSHKRTRCTHILVRQASRKSQSHHAVRYPQEINNNQTAQGGRHKCKTSSMLPSPLPPESVRPPVEGIGEAECCDEVRFPGHRAENGQRHRRAGGQLANVTVSDGLPRLRPARAHRDGRNNRGSRRVTEGTRLLSAFAGADDRPASPWTARATTLGRGARGQQSCGQQPKPPPAVALMALASAR